MIDIKQAIKECLVEKPTDKPVKPDKTLLKDARERIMRLQKKTKKSGKKNVKKIIRTKGKKNNKQGVVYLGHLPHGFYEEELKGFFSQFGKVSRVKVSRSSKTGKSKGYAFIEFAYNDVAKIVAETMNNYLMFERLLKAQYIPPERVHSNMFPVRWITSNSYPTLMRRNQLKKRQEKPISEEDKRKHRSRIEFKIKLAVNKLQEMGVNYKPQTYDPEADQHASGAHKEGKTDSEQVPRLVSILPTVVKGTTQKSGKAAKRNASKVVMEPTQD